ncbi:Uncharacterised protein [Shigella flexneri]|nr:Uncharacterised protein [Shigella flexneri]
MHRNQHDQHHAPPEDRHRVAGQRQANCSVIENGTAFNRSQHTNRNTDCRSKNHRADAKFQRGLKARHELFPYWNSAFH